ncbi:hypothetical protein BC943DRAFT_143622 [Umbelopsis sp. AD052]|nr:hypothetical protein BC943DRAFT_143622 [Umbelopsis sp. AD052]
MCKSINCRELNAIELTLQFFSWPKNSTIRSDNTTAYINKKDGTRSQSLQSASDIDWGNVSPRTMLLQARHIPGYLDADPHHDTSKPKTRVRFIPTHTGTIMQPRFDIQRSTIPPTTHAKANLRLKEIEMPFLLTRCRLPRTSHW